ncbi:hypothetical protein [Micromonospora zamorensis]|uniref:hypothetical protein n=1 Tax=Micromonospora zamorensis TaxID=709883 RepID=UPI003F4CF714
MPGEVGDPTSEPDTDRPGHGRREIRSLKILTISTGIDFPHATQAIQIRRRRRRLDQPKRFTTETVYAVTDLFESTRQNRHNWPAGSAGIGQSRTKSIGYATSPTTKTAARSAPAPDPSSWPRYATPRSVPCA